MKRRKAVARMGFKIAVAYRFASLLSLVTAPISLIIYYFLWKAIFAHSGVDVLQGFTFAEMMTYYVISTLIAFFTWSEVEHWMENDIVKGEMIMFFQRPLSMLSQYYFFELGLNMFGLLFEAIPFYIIGVIFFGLVFASPLYLGLFIISLILASVTYFMISFLIGLLAFWFNRINGISKAKRPIIALLSGALIPLSFFPDWFVTISEYLPFQYLRFVPINIFLGKYEVEKIIVLLVVQLVWLLIFIGIAKLIERKAFKKFAGSGT